MELLAGAGEALDGGEDDWTGAANVHGGAGRMTCAVTPDSRVATDGVRV
jgi:hypothetical protein